MKLIAAFAAVLLTVVSTSAQARVHHHRVASLPPVSGCTQDNNGHTICSGSAGSIAHRGNYETVQGNAVPGRPDWYYDGKVTGGRHAGDPYAFCGAEAARYVFGEAKRDLWPAANWIAKYQRASPAPGMAAARRHHVMILISHVSGSDWMVHDGNSGGHMTREHVRSIAGYVIVDPHSPRYASR
jgi:hypothetical protein